MKWFPNTIQVGDVCNLKPSDFQDVDIIIAGSPCQSISAMGKKKGISTDDGITITSLVHYEFLKMLGYGYTKNHIRKFNQSALFWEFVRMYRGIKSYNPNLKFFLENVVSKEWGKLITKELGVGPYRLNSSLVTPQNRDRYYWTNIPLTTPFDVRTTTLSDVIPGAVNGAGIRGIERKNWDPASGVKKHKGNLTIRKDGLANCVVTSYRNNGKCSTTNGDLIQISANQAERLQTIPVGYTDVNGLSDNKRMKLIGNAWTINIIIKFFENILQYEYA
jgi:site-specific DNA-cytosine methylase